MRRAITAVLAGMAVSLALTTAVAAGEGPVVCGTLSGRDFAQTHIVPMLQGGGVNNPDAHSPGMVHQGCANFPF